jgi:signal transduction histidine kinase
MILGPGQKVRRIVLYTNEKKYIFLISSSIIVLLILIQILFYFIQYSHIDSAAKGIKGIIRADFAESNSYNISKAFRDLEYLGLFECSIVKTSKLKEQPFLDLSFNKNCSSNFFLLNGITSSISLSLSNGDNWDISFKSINNNGFFYALWLTRFFTVLIILLLFKLYIEKTDKKIQLMLIQNNHSKDLEQISRQVSHDIRSPLAALNMAMQDLDQLPEGTRLILRASIQRIQDIANNLLNKTSKNSEQANKKNELQTTFLYSSLDEIVSEKRLHFRSKGSIQIEGNLSQEFGLFSKVDNKSLKRVISNMINNAVEALPDSKGVIKLNLSKDAKNAIIKIQDNGKGISPEILSKLGKEGVSFGKEGSKDSGSGIGLYHAIQTVESWKGSLKIDSAVGIGTIITIQIPLSSPPNWFLSNIKLIPNQTVCILDDDQEIHHTWDERFKDYVNKHNIKLVHFTTSDEVRLWFKNNSHKNSIFLSDYELIGRNETGLDLIKELQLAPISILITSHYEEKTIQNECKKINLKILPKMMAANINISLI